MNSKIRNRVFEEAIYILKTNQTVREVSKSFKVSKSTVHKDLKERLKNINRDLYNSVNKILFQHSKIKHIRGGEATRRKYLNLEQN